MTKLKYTFIALISMLCALTLTSCMDLYDKDEIDLDLTVTFKSNYPDGYTDKTYVQNFRNSVSQNLAPVADMFTTPTNYVFKHWAEKSDGSGQIYNDGSSHAFTNNMILYAIWQSTGGGDPVINGGGITMNVSGYSDADLGLSAWPSSGTVEMLVAKGYEYSWYLNDNSLVLPDPVEDVDTGKWKFTWNDASQQEPGEYCIMLLATKDNNTYSATVYVTISK